MEGFSRTGIKQIGVRLGMSNWSRYAGILVSLVLVSVIFSALTPYFLKERNLINIGLQGSINAVVALGMTIVIINGGIDLSVGSIVALTSLIAAQVMVDTHQIIGSIIIAFVVGIACGVLNGVLIGFVKLQPFLVTLGTMSLFRGLALIFCNGLPIRNLPQSYLLSLNSGNNSIPIPLIIMFVFALIISFLLRYTRLGEYFFAIGGNEEATRLSGVNVNWYKISAYVICGISCTIAGLIFIGRLGVADPQAGNGYELDAIAAAAIGGASLSGGKGSILGTIIGAILLSSIRNGLTLMNVQAFYQSVAVGVIILIAITLDKLSQGK